MPLSIPGRHLGTEREVIDVRPGSGICTTERVLEAAGVEFTNGDAPGVRLRKTKR